MAAFEQVQIPSLVDHAYEELRAAILSGQLPPGEAVREAGVAREMGMSRGPVREALRLLEHAGLVVQERQRGYRVATFDDTDMAELASMRVCLERLAIQQAITNPAAPGELEVLIGAMYEAERDEDVLTAIKLDRSFHEKILVLSGHRRLQQAWVNLRDQIEVAFAHIAKDYPSLHGLTAQHRPLVEAVRRSDLDGALEWLEDHVTPAVKKAWPIDPTSEGASSAPNPAADGANE